MLCAENVFLCFAHLHGRHVKLHPLIGVSATQLSSFDGFAVQCGKLD